MTDVNAIILWLSNIEGLGAKKILRILDHFGDPGEILNAPRDEFANIYGLTEINIHNIISSRDDARPEKYTEELHEKNIGFVTILDAAYPSLLKEIYDPPAMFYILGEMPDDSLKKISVIGSRRCSEYGLTVSRKLSRDLASYDIVIVSGMAKGIDASAHRGALDGNGKTVAVLGCGIDICYPSENRVLRSQIIKSGCVISEYPPGTKPMPHHFPARNRIISGLSVATIVVEAAEKSGTLITAGQALEQGREVFAVPGNVTSKLSRGTNGLIKQGAALVEGSDDIVNLLGIDEKNRKIINGAPNASLKPEEKIIYEMIGHEPVSAPEILFKSGSQAATVQYILTMLEIYGCVRKLPGQRYVRA